MGNWRARRCSNSHFGFKGAAEHRQVDNVLISSIIRILNSDRLRVPMSDRPAKPSTRITVAHGVATRARSDDELVHSWLASLASAHSRRNFGVTAKRFLKVLGSSLRSAKVEDVREALATITDHTADSTAKQYVLRVKSLLSYAHKLGYLTFNAGVVIKVKGQKVTERAGSIAKRLLSEVEVGLLIRAAPTKRDRILLQTAYAAGLRVSEIVGLRWNDVIIRGDGRIQLSILGKGGKVRQLLLAELVGQSLLSLRAGRDAGAPVYCATRGTRQGRHRLALSERAVNAMIKRTAQRAGINPAVSAHWFRHAHASHAIDRGASLPVVQETLGHDDIRTTGGYLHARPGDSSGLYLDEGIFRV
jgi:site-specific recombinase XerD